MDTSGVDSSCGMDTKWIAVAVWTPVGWIVVVAWTPVWIVAVVWTPVWIVVVAWTHTIGMDGGCGTEITRVHRKLHFIAQKTVIYIFGIVRS